MKISVCLLLCLCALEIDFSSSFGKHGPHGVGRGNRCGPHNRGHKFKHRQDNPCEDDQGVNTNELGNGGVYNNNGMFGNVERFSPSTVGLRPEYNRHGNVEPFSQTGGRGPEYPTNGYGQPFSSSTGGRTPEYNRNDNGAPFSQTGERGPEYPANGYRQPFPSSTGGRTPEYNRNDNGELFSQTGLGTPEFNRNGNVESSSPPTGSKEPDSNANGTVVPVPNGKRIIQVGANCGANQRGDTRGTCRPDF